MISKVLSSSLAGYQRASSAMNKRAGEIAAPANRRNGDLARTLVAMHHHENVAKANIKTMKTAGETVGTLLDVKA